MNTIKVTFELAHRIRRDGRTPIMLRVSSGRKMRKRISTGQLVFPKDFRYNKYGQWISANDSMAYQKNEILKDTLHKAETIIFKMGNDGILISQNNIVDYIKGKEKETSFIRYYEYVLNMHIESKRYHLSRRYNSLLKKLKTFQKGKDLEFNDITVRWLEDFQTYYLSRGLALNTVSKDLDMIKTILFRAIKEDLCSISNNPFFKFKLRYTKVKRTKLTIDEIRRIEALELQEGSRMWHTKNFFLFSFLCCGLRFGDVCRLKYSNIVDGKIIYTMNKTTNTRTITLYEKALKILEYYQKQDHNQDDYLFPILPQSAKDAEIFEQYRLISAKNALINKELKKIAKLAEISQTISFHIARHSFASIARTSKVDIYDISKSLAHSQIRTTQLYCDSLDDQAADNAVRVVGNL